MWSADGSRLLFAGPKGFQLFWQASDGSGAPELIADTARAPESWSAAARLVSYITLTGASDYDVWAFSPEDRSQRALLATPSTAQMSSRFSADGKWLAYQSNESGRYEIYVEPFPRTGARTQITDAGGERPRVVARRARDRLRSRCHALRGRGRHVHGVHREGTRRAARQGIRAGDGTAPLGRRA